MSGPAVDPARCPLCGRENECASVSGAASCWCFEVRIGRELIERIPAPARGVACVCRACAAQAQG